MWTALAALPSGMCNQCVYLGRIGIFFKISTYKAWIIFTGELLDTLPPGVDEAVAISKVVAFTKNPDYAHFTRIIFDTAPTGHTLRLLTLPDFLDASLGTGFQFSLTAAPNILQVH